MTIVGQIDGVGDEAAKKLGSLGVAADRVTFIGESFGHYVNARIAKQVGGVERIIVMNPASELGGYPPPDLRRCARVSWSFHASSVFVTLSPDSEHHFRQAKSQT
jgi:hypothetical protein